jgi:hypothetical protein
VHVAKAAITAFGQHHHLAGTSSSYNTSPVSASVTMVPTGIFR